jgi:hypothetical protein
LIEPPFLVFVTRSGIRRPHTRDTWLLDTWQFPFTVIIVCPCPNFRKRLKIFSGRKRAGTGQKKLGQGLMAYANGEAGCEVAPSQGNLAGMVPDAAAVRDTGAACSRTITLPSWGWICRKGRVLKTPAGR